MVTHCNRMLYHLAIETMKCAVFYNIINRSFMSGCRDLEPRLSKPLSMVIFIFPGAEVDIMRFFYHNM